MGLQLTLCALATRLGAWAWRASCLKEHEKKKKSTFSINKKPVNIRSNSWILNLTLPKNRGVTEPFYSPKCLWEQQEGWGASWFLPKASLAAWHQKSPEKSWTLCPADPADHGRGIHGVLGDNTRGRSSSRSALGFQHVDAAASSSSVTCFWAVFHIFVNLCCMAASQWLLWGQRCQPETWTRVWKH